jgi:hypothetical protein
LSELLWPLSGRLLRRLSSESERRSLRRGLVPLFRRGQIIDTDVFDVAAPIA